MSLSNITDQELKELYKSTIEELAKAEEEVHDAYVVYGGEYGNIIDHAEGHEESCRERLKMIRTEMEKRGIESE